MGGGGVAAADAAGAALASGAADAVGSALAGGVALAVSAGGGGGALGAGVFHSL